VIVEGWYTRQQVIRNLQIGKATYDRWVKSGMKVYSPGTKVQFVHSSELHRMLTMPVEQMPPAYRSPFAAKNAARRAGKQG